MDRRRRDRDPGPRHPARSAARAASVEAHIEVEGPEDEIEFDGPAKTTITWHHRRGGDAFGTELAAAAREGAIPDGARIWVACEAAAMRDIRRYFARERGIPAGQLITRGYWRAGEQNHPDHDYGEDNAKLRRAGWLWQRAASNRPVATTTARAQAGVLKHRHGRQADSRTMTWPGAGDRSAAKAEDRAGGLAAVRLGVDVHGGERGEARAP